MYFASGESFYLGVFLLLAAISTTNYSTFVEP